MGGALRSLGRAIDPTTPKGRGLAGYVMRSVDGGVDNPAAATPGYNPRFDRYAPMPSHTRPPPGPMGAPGYAPNPYQANAPTPQPQQGGVGGGAWGQMLSSILRRR